MKRIFVALTLTLVCVSGVYAQGKGVDRQGERIRDAGSDRLPANNGSNQSVGTGRGIDFGRGRTSAAVAVPNPLRVTARREELMRAIEELMRERRLVVDAAASRPDAGIIVSQPYTFSKGTIVTASELARYASVPEVSDRNWTRGRYTLSVEVQPIDTIAANISANARIEGKGESVAGPEWVSLSSSGIVEQEFLSALIAKLNDSPLPAQAPRP